MDVGFSYGVTDGLDLGWMVTSGVITGLRWKYSLFQAPDIHALTVGGRCMTNTKLLLFNLSNFHINWHTDLRNARILDRAR